MSKSIWRGVLICLTAGVLWLTSNFCWDLWQYHRLDLMVPIQVTKYKLKCINPSKFALKIYYFYEINETKYFGKYQLKNLYFLNRYAVEDQIKRWEGKRNWQGWVNSKQRHYSALEKNLPLQKGIYAALVLGLLLYCIYLHHYLETLSKTS